MRVKKKLVSALTAGILPLAAAAGPAQAAGADGAAGPHGGLSSRWEWIWSGSAPATTETSLANVRTIIGADSGSAATLTGKGVGVALIDTGVAPVPGLPAAQVVNGPDLSFESQAPSMRYLDAYGHGTHMAGIIVGNDPTTKAKGIAPGAKLTSIKVGTANGAVDVSQVIAAVDWVVAHRLDDPAAPIKVINLSYGSGGDPHTWSDPLQFAVEQAWKAGIVVVASAGNEGGYKLSNPANDPMVLTVGAASTKGTTSTADDRIASFTNNPTYGRRLDVVAPGESIMSLRVPGSAIDAGYPNARVGATLFKGSGTSQAAAVASGAIALLLQARPTLTPDLVKDILKDTGAPLIGEVSEINVNRALAASTLRYTQRTVVYATGSGNLQDARGDSAVVSDGVALTGERSIFGPFNAVDWSAKARARSTWNKGVWMGYRAAGDGWTGTSWASKTWAPAAWTGKTWSGAAVWTDPSWSGRFWAGGTWNAGTWSGRFWANDDWSGADWE